MSGAGDDPTHEQTVRGPYESDERPECAIVLRSTGLLIVCDAIQHYANYRRQSLLARVMFPFLGFRKTTQVGPLWRKYMEADGNSIGPDFERLAALDFQHLISAHGDLVRDRAHDAVRAAVDRAFAAT